MLTYPVAHSWEEVASVSNLVSLLGSNAHIFSSKAWGPVALGLVTVPPPSLCLYVLSLSIELSKQFISGSGILVDKHNLNEVTDAVSAVQGGLARASHHTLPHTSLTSIRFQLPLLDSHSLPSQTMARDISLASPVTQEQNLLCLGKKVP